MALKSQAATSMPHWSPPRQSPEAWLKERDRQNVLAFCMWGNGERYLYGTRRQYQADPPILPRLDHATLL